MNTIELKWGDAKSELAQTNLERDEARILKEAMELKKNHIAAEHEIELE